MFSTDDTIVAVATPAGHGGIGIVRLSGPAAGSIVQRLAARVRAWPARRVVRTTVATTVAKTDVLVTFFAAPASYTGQHVCEIAAPGNPLVLASIVAVGAYHWRRMADY